MAEYRLSNQAKADLNEIADYTIEKFGIDQARRYRDGLETCFQATPTAQKTSSRKRLGTVLIT